MWARAEMGRANAESGLGTEPSREVQRAVHSLGNAVSPSLGASKCLPAQAGRHLADGNLKSLAAALRHEPISTPSWPFHVQFFFFLIVREMHVLCRK